MRSHSPFSALAVIRKAGTRSMSSFEVEVVNYNVLCGKLGLGNTQCEPEHIVPDTRFERIVRDLQDPMKRNAVICLQEIGQEWAGKFSKEFQNRNYHLIYAPYGSAFNDFMGVAMAIPNDKFRINQAIISKPAALKSWPKPPKPSQFESIVNWFSSLLNSLLGKETPPDPWKISKGKKNSMIVSTLECKSSGGKVCIGTYHMPCVFWCPSVMVIHSALALRNLQDVASGIPYIFSGDFNIKPEDGVYSMYTTGSLEETHADYPAPVEWDSWRPTLTEPVKSAYVECEGSEPEFTNHGCHSDHPIFTGTLDYLFHSPLVETCSVMKLPSLSDMNAEKPIPDSRYPSDHLMIGGVFRVPL